MFNKILQWNCRGLKSNFNEILLLLTTLNPAILCLQETFLKENDTFDFKGYKSYNHIHTMCDKAAGGSTILVDSRIPHSKINLNSELQAVAIRVTLHKVMTICSVYLPPNSNIHKSTLNDLVEQLPTPYIIVGDFNGHNPLWGCSDYNNMGKTLEDFITENDICLMNNKMATYLHPATGHYSSLDLALCHPSLYLDYSWGVHDDLCGSDHFPIILNNESVNLNDNTTYWRMNRANWELFSIFCNEELNSSTFENADDKIHSFSKLLHSIAVKCIPKTSAKSKRNKPWFNEECKRAIRKRRAALKKFNIKPTSANLNDFRNERAKSRKIIKQAKRKSWQKFISGITSKTTAKNVWSAIRKISGKVSNNTVNHLKTNNSVITNKKDISDTLAKGFAQNSSSENYSKEFQNVKQREEKQKINFKSNNSENYNQPFSLRELREALEKSHDTAAGPDDIPYQFLKHLPHASLQLLLSIYNEIWFSGDVPDSWKNAFVIPIPKQGKDPTDPTSYRPIALTSCICKTLERMINTRLVWYLESNNLLTEFQSEFRNQRSTLDHLVRFETFIRDAFIKKEHLVAVFFDLEKAYDTTWKHGILKDLGDLGLKGRLPTFINSFLSDRNFQVKIGSTLSSVYKQEQGVPQGSILSVTLFNIKINSIVKTLNPGVDCSLYVDDFLICYRSKHMNTIERQLQQCLNKLQTWSNKNGFKFSSTKTNCVHFCQKRSVHNDPELFLNNIRIPVVKETRFLGIIFDNKLSFIPHIKYVKTKCLKALNLLKFLSHTDWGADRKVLLQLYRSLVRSKLDYGSIVYGSARRSYLQMLDAVHHQGLRLALGAFRTSPVESLYVEANEPSLYLRREKLTLQFVSKVKSNPKNPAYDTIFKPKYEHLYERKPNAIKPFGLRILELIQSSNIDLNKVIENNVFEFPLWQLKSPNVDLSFNNNNKSKTNPLELHLKFLEMRDRKYSDYIEIYTDGSKADSYVGCASISKFHRLKQKLHPESSIFTAEIQAVNLSLDFISEHTGSKFVVFTDSLSVLQSIKSINLTNPHIRKLLMKLNEISTDKHIVFCWLPSHVGIRGNEDADKCAKSVSDLTEADICIPHFDFKSCINRYILSKWQTSWDCTIDNKLHSIKPTVGISNSFSRDNRREDVALTRCRIGHTRITHSYLLQRENQPECVPCQEPLTVKHILLDCIDTNQIRYKYYNVNTMFDLFRNVSDSKLVCFLNEIGILKRL